MTKNFLESCSLKGKLLLATPSVQGSYFDRSVIYICAHNEHGAMGVFVNQVHTDFSYQDLLEQLGISKGLPIPSAPIHFGGPVDMEKGFVLHTDDYTDNIIQTCDGIALSSNVQILERVVQGKGPKQTIVALGHAGWGAGQLEDEVARDLWLVAPANLDIIFKTENCFKWEKSARSLGVDISRYYEHVGHA